MKILKIDLDNLELRTIGQWPLLIRNSLVIAAVILVFVIGKTFFLDDQWTHFQDLKAERQKKQKDFENLCQYANSLESYRVQVNEVRQALTNVLRQLPSQNEQANLL